jgi:hypothetical protein
VRFLFAVGYPSIPDITMGPFEQADTVPQRQAVACNPSWLVEIYHGMIDRK